jgi:hypothetical protein
MIATMIRRAGNYDPFRQRRDPYMGGEPVGPRGVLHPPCADAEPGRRGKLCGPADECEAELREKITLAKQGGGYMYHSDHLVPPEVSFARYQ